MFAGPRGEEIVYESRESDKLTRALTSVRFKSFLRISDRSPHITGGGKPYGNAGRQAGTKFKRNVVTSDVRNVFLMLKKRSCTFYQTVYT